MGNVTLQGGRIIVVFPKFMTIEPEEHALSSEELASYRIFIGKPQTS